jgi:GT2 family glycosyltransferase
LIKVEIVTPVHNRKDITLQCLRSILRLTSEGLAIHTIIVDDGSTDGTSEAVAANFPETEVIRADGSLWFTEGTNVGVSAALGYDPDYVLLINDDQVFDADAIAHMVECAERHPRSVVGPLLLLWDQPHLLFQTAPVWRTMLGGWRHWFHQTVWSVPKRPFEVDIIVGNCVLVPAKAIRECGLMDSRRYPNYGDAEYTPRLRRNGWRLIIEPRARVFCQPNTAPKRITSMSFREKARVLLLDVGHPHNLRRRFRSMWDTAPTRTGAVAAFIVFFVRLAMGRNLESSWALRLTEPPLSETFRDRTL